MRAVYKQKAPPPVADLSVRAADIPERKRQSTLRRDMSFLALGLSLGLLLCLPAVVEVYGEVVGKVLHVLGVP